MTLGLEAMNREEPRTERLRRLIELFLSRVLRIGILIVRFVGHPFSLLWLSSLFPLGISVKTSTPFLSAPLIKWSNFFAL